MKIKYHKWYYIFMVIFFLLITGCSASKIKSSENIQSASVMPKEGLGIGNLAPNFEIQMDQKTIKLSDLKGKPVFLNFWATWCSYCKAEMPSIEQRYQENHPVQIIAVNVKEKPMQVRSFMVNTGYSFPVAYDVKGEIAALYMANGLPTSYGIDSNGIIRYKIQGLISNDKLQEWFHGLE